ncbi:MAG: hypothetical protein LBR25_06435 [Erysipelotrichaceae bacterium]|jgi:hypothetical protein|nr:hypothetical protein [Erysipelotrichaceae bacterium]
MLKIRHSDVYNFENALRGARNPMNSWGRMDSSTDESGNFILGDNDRKLALALCKAGSDHRKFLRQIFVCMDIDAPLYWWKEFDTYKVATTANSASTMHKIHSKAFTLEDFSHEHLSEEGVEVLGRTILYLEKVRLTYNENKDKQDWWDLIQLLPTSYNQLRTVTLSYETLRNQYHARKDHKLDEWHTYCDFIADLPYGKEFIVGQE